MSYIKVPYLQVRSNCLIYYELLDPAPGRRSTLPIKKSYSGDMSQGAAKRIKKAIDIFLQKSPERWIYNPVTTRQQKFRLNFVTLTVSDSRNININEGYRKLLKPFLRKIRKSGDFSYIWKAEFQKRGQLHYHVTSNQFIHWQTIRTTWNNLQRKARLLDSYAKVHGHFDANSTDVHAVYKVKDIGSYLSKYMVKPVYDPSYNTSGNKPKLAKGKVWDCSIDLKKQRYSFIPTNEQFQKLQSMKDHGKCDFVDLEHCMIIRMDQPYDVLTLIQKQEYLKWKS